MSKKATKAKKAPKAPKAPKAEKKRPKVDISNMTYQQLKSGLKGGTFTEKELRGAYNRLRNIVTKAIWATQGTQYRFEDGEVPWFPLARDLTNSRDLLKASADIGRLIQGHNYTPKQRAARYNSTFEKRRRSLASRFGVSEDHITQSYIENLGRFMKWFRSSVYQYMYDSDSSVIDYAITNGSSSAEWSAILGDYVKAHGYGGDEDVTERG